MADTMAGALKRQLDSWLRMNRPQISQIVAAWEIKKQQICVNLRNLRTILLSMFVTHLECSACHLRHDWSRLQNLCTACQKPLFAIYDLAAASRRLRRETLATRKKSLWRYREVLPLPEGVEPVSLGERGTPLLRAARFGGAVGLSQLWIKDESQNPTQSFKARGMAVAVSMAKHLGATKLAVPSAGNAGGALAAYAARAGLEAHIFMPRDTPRANIIECCELGAHLTLIDGLITDCGAEIAKRKRAEGWFDMSTLKEPYRVEGKKTLGYELAEQLDWRLPDVILYPTGGGTGLIGMWKAFRELTELGWLPFSRDAQRCAAPPKLPRLVSCQSDGCAPIVRAFESGARFAEPFPNAHTIASGLRVPAAVGDFMMLDAIRESGGCAIAGREAAIADWMRRASAATGISVCPETAVCFDCIERLK